MPPPNVRLVEPPGLRGVASNLLVRPNMPLFQRVKVPLTQIAQSASKSYLMSGGGDSPDESSGVLASAARRGPRSVRPSGVQSIRPYAKANQLSLRQVGPTLLRIVGNWERRAHQEGAKAVIAGNEPGRHPAGSPAVEEDGMVERSGGERGKVSVSAKTHPYGKAIHITGMGSWRAGPRLTAEVVVAKREGQHEPSGAKDLWVEGARRSAGRRAWPLCLTSPADNRGTQPWAGETTAHEIWAPTVDNRDCIEGIGGVRAGLIRWSLANSAVADLHLSPDGGKHHVRWGGGGQDTGARAQASSACGLTLDLVHPRLPGNRSGRIRAAV